MLSFDRIALRKHFEYLKREAVQAASMQIDRELPDFFDAQNNDVDAEKFIHNIADDRHHFRLIVAPENGTKSELRFHIRELISDMEKDLKVKLNYAAIIHKNTENPHAHLVIRGVEAPGKDLIIKADYLTKGIRNRCQELLTLELGSRTENEISTSKQKALLQDRPIQIDYKLAEEATKYNHKITPAIFKNTKTAQNAKLRLEYLHSIGLVKKLSQSYKNVYVLDKDLIAKLKQLDIKKDVYKKLAKQQSISIYR